MFVDEKTLFVAGPKARSEPSGPGFLRAISREDGTKFSEIALPAPPVHDGMAAARGRVFLVLKDGSVISLLNK